MNGRGGGASLVDNSIMSAIDASKTSSQAAVRFLWINPSILGSPLMHFHTSWASKGDQ